MSFRPRRLRWLLVLAVFLSFLYLASFYEGIQQLERIAPKVLQWPFIFDGAQKEISLDGQDEAPPSEAPSVEHIQPPPDTHITIPSGETTIPNGAHSHGFTVFDKLYMRNGTIFIVTDNEESLPPRIDIIAKPYKLATINADPTDEDLQFVSLSKSKEVLGELDQAMRISGFSVIVNDASEFMKHYYHWWGEVILGFWRIYSKVGTNDDGTLSVLPPPARFILPGVTGGEWRDSAGMDGPLMRAAWPDSTVEEGDYWQDLVKLNTTFVFDRAMIVNRETAHKDPHGKVWFKMIAGSMKINVAEDYWVPVRESVIKNVLGFIPRMNSAGAIISPPHLKSEKPLVLYISRQGGGRRLRDEDHEGLVKALRELEDEGLCDVQIVMMEKMEIREQLLASARSTVMVAVHGNGLTHQLWMPHSARSTVIEMFYPGCYAFDYEMLARNMGHRHYGFWNDTFLTYPKGEYRKEGTTFGDNFHADNITVHGPAVAKVIKDRLTFPLVS